MKTVETLWTRVRELYYPPPRYGTLKVAVAAHPELDHYVAMGDTVSMARELPTAWDAEIKLSLGMIDYILANAETFDPRDTPYVKAIRAQGDMSLVHHFAQLLKRPSPEIRDVYNELAEREYAAPRSIEVLDEFDSDAVLQAASQSRPIVLRGAMKSPLVGLSVDEFVRRFGHVVLRENPVAGKRETVVDIGRQINDPSIDRVYLNGVEVPAELAPHLEFPMIDASAFSIGLLWWGKKKSSGVITKLHRDFQISFLGQVWGQKKLHLFSPDQTDALYAAPAFNMYQLCEVDPGAPDLVRYPRFAHARALEVVVGPGDMLVIPTGWFHCVWALTDVLSVNRFMQEATMRQLRLGHAVADAR